VARKTRAIDAALPKPALAPQGPDKRLKLRGWKASPRAGVDLLDRDKLFDLMDGR